MLSQEELELLFVQHQIPETGRKVIKIIREELPERASGGSSKAVKARYVPMKMPFVLEADAFNTELAAIVTYDHDEETLEIYPQPLKLKISYVAGNGKRTTHYTTPDLFLIREDVFIYIECKTEEDLLELAKISPNRYLLDEHGVWRSPPAEAAAEKYGCQFRVRSTAENNWPLIENLEFLRDYLTAENLSLPQDAKDMVLAQFEKNSWMTVHELIHGTPTIESDWIFSLIVLGELFFELTQDRIADYEHAIVFRDLVSAKAYRIFARSQVGLKSPIDFNLSLNVGVIFKWDGRVWRIVNQGEKSLWIQRLDRADSHAELVELDFETLYQLAGDGKLGIVPDSQEDLSLSAEAREILKRASPNDIKIASQKYEVLFGAPAPAQNKLALKSARSKAYWLAQWRTAELKYRQGFVGLLPNPNKTQGNHHPKIDEAVSALIEYAIESDWKSIRQKHFQHVYGKLIYLCEEKGFITPSYQTFVARIKKQLTYKDQKARVGEKAAYDMEPQFLALEFTTARHGNRPFHIGHIDHTPIPLKLLDSSMTKVIKTVWLTLLIDAFSRKVLAFYLSFDKPSYRSCMMVIRDCVRRHSRVPQWIVVDQGSDFISAYFEQLLAWLGVHKKERPGGKPRFGATLERLFKTTMTQFIQVLMGSTKIYEKHYRQISKEVDPVKHAIWTIDRLDRRLEQYFFEVYHAQQHATLGMTPAQMFDLGIKESGARTHKLIIYNEEFLIHTMPSTAKGMAKVTPKGVKIQYRYYNCEAFNFPGVQGKSLPIRYDPFNAGLAHVFVDGVWHKCYSEYYAIFKNYSEKQIQLVTNYLHLKGRKQNQNLSINARILVDFLDSVEAEEVLEMQKLHDGENQLHREKITQVPGGISSQPPKEPLTVSPKKPHTTPELLEDL